MRPGRLSLLVALLAVLVGGAPAVAAASQAPGRVHVDWAATDVTVGDRVPVEISVVVPAGMIAGDGAEAAPRFPTWRDTWGEAEILEVGELEEVDPATVDARAVASSAAGTGSDRNSRSHRNAATGGDPEDRRAWRQSLVLAAFRPGSVPLPPREILVPTAEGRSLRLTTPPDLALEVLSVLPETGEGGAGDGGDEAPVPEPMEAKSMVALPVGAAFWWTAAAFTLALLAAGLLYHRRRAAEATGGATRSEMPPAAELHRALADARQADSPQQGLAGVSRALRRYLGRRLAFPAVESTTTEVRRHLRRAATPPGMAARCGEILAACDLVKFARRPAVHGDVRRWAEAAAEVADGLEDHLRPAETEGANGGATGAGAGAGREEAA